MSGNSNTNCGTNTNLDILLYEFSIEDLDEAIKILKERYNIK